MLKFRNIQIDKVLLSKCKLCNNFEPLQKLLSDSLKQKLFVNTSDNDFCLGLKSLGIIYNFDGSLKGLVFWNKKTVYVETIEEIISSDINIGLTRIFECGDIKVYISKFNKVVLVLKGDILLNAFYFDNSALVKEESVDYLKLFLDSNSYFLDKETGNITEEVFYDFTGNK